MPAPWIHELRNAVNAVSANAAVVRILLERGETERALHFNDEALKACERSRVLLNQWTDAADEE